MTQADRGSKWLIGHSPQAWVEWLFDDPTTQVEAQLSPEFQFITRLSDSLLLVSRQGERFLRSRSGKEAAVTPPPPLETARESFPSSRLSISNASPSG